MIRRISALIWLRTQMILSNGAMLFQIIFPYALLILYDRFLNPDHDPSGIDSLNGTNVRRHLYSMDRREIK